MRAYRNSGFVFAGVFACAIAAFWPSYVATSEPIDAYMHVHAVLMIAWFALAIAQVTFAKTDLWLDLVRAFARL